MEGGWVIGEVMEGICVLLGGGYEREFRILIVGYGEWVFIEGVGELLVGGFEGMYVGY